MSTKAKKVVTAIIVLVGLLFGAYVLLTDNDPNTNPDPAKIVDAAKDVYNAATAKPDAGKTTEK